MQLAGLAIVVVGLALISIPLAIIVGGMMVSGVGYLREMHTLSERENDEGPSDDTA
jgi:hypothetical protein